jgi:uroporphyrinogen-III synthase
MPVKKSTEKSKIAGKTGKKLTKTALAPAPKKEAAAAPVPVARINGSGSAKAALPQAKPAPVINGHKPAATGGDGQTRKPRKSPRKGTPVPAPLPPVEVSNYPKNRVKEILVSQPKPPENEKNPYYELAKKHNVHVSFRQFLRVEGLTAQEFRTQRIDILEHGAVILTSKLAVDHYFRICNEMRITVPETMKYFCINEQTAYYLQKYIQYRKRKIFFGHGTIGDLVDVIKKNRAEKFLLPSSDAQKEQIVEFLEDVRITFTRAVFYKTVPADLSDMKSLNEFDVIVFFTPVGIQSVKKNFPNFRQGNTRIAAFGHTAAQTLKQLGLRLDIFAPTPQNPSMTSALDAYIKEANKR